MLWRLCWSKVMRERAEVLVGPDCHCSFLLHLQLTFQPSACPVKQQQHQVTSRHFAENPENSAKGPFYNPTVEAGRDGFRILHLPFTDSFLLSSSHSCVRTHTYNKSLVQSLFLFLLPWLTVWHSWQQSTMLPFLFYTKVHTHTRLCFFSSLFPKFNHLSEISGATHRNQPPSFSWLHKIPYVWFIYVFPYWHIFKLYLVFRLDKNAAVAFLYILLYA